MSLSIRRDTISQVVLLISTYDLGRQPFGLASAGGGAAGRGHRGRRARDLARASSSTSDVVRRAATLVAFFLPMHTATRLALPVHRPRARAEPGGAAGRLRAVRAAQRRCSCASAASPTIIGGEFEDALVDAASAQPASAPRRRRSGRVASVPRVTFRVPDRTGLPPLARYATLQIGTASAGSPATPRPAAAASTAAGTVRSCRSTTAASASSRSTS